MRQMPAGSGKKIGKRNMPQVILITPNELEALVRQAVKAELITLQSQQSPSIMSVSDAASYLNLDKSTLDRYRIEKRGPAYSKIGSRVIYRKSDLDAWLEQCKIRTLDSDLL